MSRPLCLRPSSCVRVECDVAFTVRFPRSPLGFQAKAPRAAARRPGTRGISALGTPAIAGSPYRAAALAMLGDPLGCMGHRSAGRAEIVEPAVGGLQIDRDGGSQPEAAARAQEAAGSFDLRRSDRPRRRSLGGGAAAGRIVWKSWRSRVGGHTLEDVDETQPARLAKNSRLAALHCCGGVRSPRWLAGPPLPGSLALRAGRLAHARQRQASPGEEAE